MRFQIACLSTLITLVIHFYFIAFGQYEHGYADILTHGLGGFSMGLFGLWLWYEGIEEIRFKKRFERIVKWWIMPLFVVGFVAIIGIVWEWHEYILDVLRPTITRQPSIPDTMLDYFMDLLGAGVAIMVAKKRL